MHERFYSLYHSVNSSDKNDSTDNQTAESCSDSDSEQKGKNCKRRDTDTSKTALSSNVPVSPKVSGNPRPVANSHLTANRTVATNSKSMEISKLPAHKKVIANPKHLVNQKVAANPVVTDKPRTVAISRVAEHSKHIGKPRTVWYSKTVKQPTSVKQEIVQKYHYQNSEQYYDAISPLCKNHNERRLYI